MADWAGAERTRFTKQATGADDRGLTLALRQDAPIPLDVSFSANPGTLLALVGPSGSGKTSVLRAIAGLMTPRTGTITCDGETWLDTSTGASLSPQQRRAGLVFQDYALFPHLDALETVALAITGPDPDTKRARARDWLRRVNLEGLESRKPAQLSGGQQQRVALARALAREPRVLLLDEPFSAVDQRTRERLKLELAMLRNELLCPIVLVTHDLEEALALADRIGVLSRGRLLQLDRPDIVTTRPRSPMVARLVGETNIFKGSLAVPAHEGAPGRLDWPGGSLELRTPSGNIRAPAPIDWMIPAEAIVLHRRGRPAIGDRENPVPGRIVRLTHLGDRTAVSVAPAVAPDLLLNFRLPTHSARRNELQMAADVTVSLLADDLHIFPAADEDGP